MSTGFFAGLAEEAGTSSFDGTLPQSMRIPVVTSHSGPAIMQAMQQHGSGPKRTSHSGFPAPSGFAGPSPERRP